MAYRTTERRDELKKVMKGGGNTRKAAGYSRK